MCTIPPGLAHRRQATDVDIESIEIRRRLKIGKIMEILCCSCLPVQTALIRTGSEIFLYWHITCGRVHVVRYKSQ